MHDDTVTDTVPAPRPRFQRLRDRLAGRPADTTLRRDIPEPLAPVLRHWIRLASQHDSDAPQRVALRLGLSPVPGRRPGQFSFLEALCAVTTDPDLLDVIDALLAVHRAPSWARDRGRYGQVLAGDAAVQAEIADRYAELVGDLISSLEDAGSAYTVSQDARSLVERVDPTIIAAVEQTIDAAPPTPGDLLRDAWSRAYGLHPDPSTAYHQAVRAVEAIAGPLVLPNNPKPSLGTVIKHLGVEAPHKWRFVLVDKDGDYDVKPVVAMMDRLWTGEVSRHSGGQHNRDQTPVEARAAVHLAAALVQLLSTGALARREQT